MAAHRLPFAAAGTRRRAASFRDVDVARLLELLFEAVPDSATRRAILADNPARLYGFEQGTRFA